MLSGATARLAVTSLFMAAALSRIAVATAVHLVSWSGVTLSAVFSVVMRSSTVSDLALVAAATAGGLLGAVWAIAGANVPAISAAPIADAVAREIRRNRYMSCPFGVENVELPRSVLRRKKLRRGNDAPESSPPVGYFFSWAFFSASVTGERPASV